MNGSGYSLFSFECIYCNIDGYKPLRASLYIQLPDFLLNKKCIINVQNSDNTCFSYALCSALHHNEIKKNHNRPSVYEPYIKEFVDFAKEINVEFPMKIDSRLIKKYENKFNISINKLNFSQTFKA